jgi:hypothetical protein
MHRFVSGTKKRSHGKGRGQSACVEHSCRRTVRSDYDYDTDHFGRQRFKRCVTDSIACKLRDCLLDAGIRGYGCEVAPCFILLLADSLEENDAAVNVDLH